MAATASSPAARSRSRGTTPAAWYVFATSASSRYLDMSPATLTRPASDEYSPDFRYAKLAPEGDLLAYLELQLADLIELLSGLSDREALAHHVPYTWSVKQVVGHMTDTERVFG